MREEGGIVGGGGGNCKKIAQPTSTSRALNNGAQEDYQLKSRSTEPA